MNNFIPHLTGQVITYACWGSSKSMLVKGASAVSPYLASSQIRWCVIILSWINTLILINWHSLCQTYDNTLVMVLRAGYLNLDLSPWLWTHNLWIDNLTKSRLGSSPSVNPQTTHLNTQPPTHPHSPPYSTYESIYNDSLIAKNVSFLC